jgi:predicted DNA-binding transcriptional regulator AlpA
MHAPALDGAALPDAVEGPRDHPAAGRPESLTAPLVPLLLRAAAAAKYCGVSEATFWRWDSAGRIPRGRKISAGVKVWSRPELEAWAAAGCPERRTWESMKPSNHR